ncbi:BCCT family transporter [Nocardia thailandica]|uniref:BCCT family transporter n=1 Tax=Nocardia thailandica TaxID=257275 RepID=A0ABW6PPM7_9NOCA|nr:BCCT family transporter [Nocardia thailandica]
MSNHGARDIVPPGPPVAGRSPRRRGLDLVVFGVTAIGSLLFVGWGVLSPDGLATAASNAQSWVITDTGWLFVLVSSAFVVFVIWLAVSRYGRIPLGEDGETPEFRTVSWIAMMFSAGMGIGLMFWGVAEPLSHFVSPPPHTAAPGSPEAGENAMAITLFHWTLHPWAIYAVAGLAIAYGTFRRGRRQLISQVFRPLLGARADGLGGRIIDMMAIFATLFGSAASLGLGALQIGAGMQFNGWIDSIGKAGLVLIIAVLTVAFVFSAVSGIERGVQWLSNINMVLALVIAAFVFVAGPTLLVLNVIPTAIGDYIDQLATMASRTGAGDPAMQTWLSKWTIFYWAWWISWTPFVGMFIARISRGRTIRQFVTGVLLVPSAVSLLWFAVFGGSAIAEQTAHGDLTERDGSVDSDFALFHLLDQYPIATATTVLVMILVAIFFVSGADAASLVMGTLSEKGNIEPTRLPVIFWGAATGAVAAIMLAIADPSDLGGALNGLQALTTVVALPFLLVMVGMCVALYKDLREDPIIVRADRGVELVETAVDTGLERHDGDFVLVTEPAQEIEIPPDAAELTSGDPAVEPGDIDPAGEGSPAR